MKTKILSLSMIFILSLGLLSNCYADQYIQNLHDQIIRHLETQGYHFTNIGDGWHTLKPMQSICCEASAPPNSQKIMIKPYIRGRFRQEYAYLVKLWRNYTPFDTDIGEYGEWIWGNKGLDRSSDWGFTIPVDDTIRYKECFQNISRSADFDVKFDVYPYN